MLSLVCAVSSDRFDQVIRLFNGSRRKEKEEIKGEMKNKRNVPMISGVGNGCEFCAERKGAVC